MDKSKIYIKKRKFKKKKHSILPTIVLFLTVAGFGVSSYLAYEYAVERNQKLAAGYEVIVEKEDAVEFKVPFNASTADIADMLFERGLIKSVLMYKIISNIYGYDGMYSSGTHLLKEGMQYEDIMIVLTSLPEIVRVTFPEGFTVSQIKARLAANGLVDPAVFDKTVTELDISDYEMIVPGKVRDNRLEGYLFPDTYEFDKNAGEEYIINRLLRRFEEMIDDEMFARTEKLERSMDEIVIIASMLEKEANSYDERRKIAGVLYNRLASEDSELSRLQVDATIQYVLVKRGGQTKEFLTTEDTRINDRYNTYVYSGLPPGPICSPGLESIMAALYPENHDFYYYALNPDGSGTHIFSKTYEEHLEAIGN